MVEALLAGFDGPLNLVDQAHERRQAPGGGAAAGA
jgi:hypothetical protein